MTAEKAPNYGRRVGTHGDWTAWVKQGGRGSWWWSLRRGESAFAASPPGLRAEEDATKAVRVLLAGLRASDALPEVVASKNAAVEAEMDMRSQRDKTNKTMKRALCVVAGGCLALGYAAGWVVGTGGV